MNEKMSALMDGELSREEAMTTIKTLGSDAAQRDCWDAYHLIGACMRGDLPNEAVKRVLSRNSRTEAIFAKLAMEPTVLAPAAIRKSAPIEGRTRIALAMAASVATISVIGAIALKQQPGGNVAPIALVQHVAPQPVADAAVQRAQADQRVNDYLVVHRQFANPGAYQAATLSQPRDSADSGKRAAGR